METNTITTLALFAAGLGISHTLMGPDHYLPFVAIGKARRWSIPTTLTFTAFCGLGHVLGSIILGMIGIAAGIAVGQLEAIEGSRGNWAAWILMTIGLVYFIWGVKNALRNRPHTHRHFHVDGSLHEHEHVHQVEHLHEHGDEKKVNVTGWALFIFFVFGPCEPLIPLLMYPAAKFDWTAALIVASVFAIATITTMTAVVAALSFGLSWIKLPPLERFTHAAAGATIFSCGVVVFMGF